MVPWTLRLATTLTVLQVSAGVVIVLVSDRFPIPGRVLLASCLGLGYLFARSARRLRAGGAFGLFILELTGLLVAAGATSWPAAGRVGLVVLAITIIGLVLASLHAFPTATLPS